MGTRVQISMRIFLFSLFFPLLSMAQGLAPLMRGIDHISINRQGNILAATDKGDVWMLDSSGKVLQQFSPRRPTRIHLLEAWNGLRIFAFNRDFQHYFLLDRFLLSDGPVALDRERGYARLLAPAQDGNLWLLDEAAFELRKIDIQNGKTLFSTPLDLILPRKNYDFSFMREYENQLYIADRRGELLVFDQNGSFRKKLPLENIGWFGFAGEELYVVQKGELIWFHLQRNTIRKVVLIPEISESGELIPITGRYFCLQHGALFLVSSLQR